MSDRQRDKLNKSKTRPKSVECCHVDAFKVDQIVHSGGRPYDLGVVTLTVQLKKSKTQKQVAWKKKKNAKATNFSPAARPSRQIL